MSSPERWEAQQLVASGVLDIRDHPEFDEEAGGLLYQEEGEEQDIEIELNEDEPAFLRGQTPGECRHLACEDCEEPRWVPAARGRSRSPRSPRNGASSGSSSSGRCSTASPRISTGKLCAPPSLFISPFAGGSRQGKEAEQIGVHPPPFPALPVPLAPMSIHSPLVLQLCCNRVHLSAPPRRKHHLGPASPFPCFMALTHCLFLLSVLCTGPGRSVMPESGERALGAKSCGVGLAAYDMPDWKKDAFGKAPTFGQRSKLSIQEQRQTLPIYKLKNELIQAVEQQPGPESSSEKQGRGRPLR